MIGLPRRIRRLAEKAGNWSPVKGIPRGWGTMTSSLLFRRFKAARIGKTGPQTASAGGAVRPHDLLRALVIVAALAAAECSGNGGKPSDENVAAPMREMEGFTLVETHNGVKRMEIVGSQMTEHPDQQSLDVQEVKADFYDETGRHQSVLTARTGTVDTQTGNMTVRGEVVVVTDDGVRLETEELRWLDDRRRIVTELPVRIVRETGEVRGVGLDTDPELREFRLGSKIEGEWRELPPPTHRPREESGSN